MGEILGLSCPSCRFQGSVWVGIGFIGFIEYCENTVNDKYKKKEKTIKAFLDDYPDGMISIDGTIALCPSCGDFRGVKEMGMYIPTDKKILCNETGQLIYDGVDKDYRWFYDNPNYHKLYKRYPHKCKKCGGIMKALMQSELYEITEIDEICCPVCGHHGLKVQNAGCWD